MPIRSSTRWAIAPKPPQSNLCSRTFYGVNSAKQAVNVFRIIVAFKREQAIAHNLQVFFGFRLEEFVNFVRHFVVGGQCIEIGASEPGMDSFRQLCCFREEICLRVLRVQHRT